MRLASWCWCLVPFAIAAAFEVVSAPLGARADEKPPATYDHGVRLAPNPRQNIPLESDPARIYLRDCASCHGADAHGTELGPSLAGAGRAGVFYWLSTGRMPIRDAGERLGRRAPAYPPETLDRLVDYAAALAGGHGPDIPKLGPGNVADGLQLFGLECASCHAWSGSGSIITDGKVPTVRRATPEQIATAIRIGPGEMPAFGPAAFDQRQLNDVVAYVQSLKHNDDAGGWGIFHRGPLAEGAAALVLGLGVLLAAITYIGTKARSRERAD